MTKTILVPVDGASNIKLEALDFETLATVSSAVAASPSTTHDGLAYNATGDELDWFDQAIAALPAECRSAAVIAPVARGASGGLVGADNTLCEVPGRRLTLSYTQGYPETVDARFRELAGTREDFFQETGSIRDFPGSLTLLKRFLFEEMMRPELLAKSASFAQYGALLGGHFIGNDYLAAIRQAGNEHSYWMCHSGTRDVRAKPGTPSRAAGHIAAFRRLVPAQASVCYQALGTMPAAQAASLGLATPPLVIPGGHDTCLSHLPILSTFYQAYPDAIGKPVIQVEAGTWTMIAQMGGAVEVPGDGFTRDIIIQGTVDGEPVVTARYGGGADFAFLKKFAQEKGRAFETHPDLAKLATLLTTADCFILPNLNPSHHGTGPFPGVKGRIINEASFLADGATAWLATTLLTTLATARQVEAISHDTSVPIVLTAGGSRNSLSNSMLATLSAHPVYAMVDKNGQAVTETTTLGAAIAGKAACLGIHPYQVETAALGVKYQRIKPLTADLAQALAGYRARWLQLVGGR
jgi:sugar (pentulose or hexulose) kinase